MELIDNKSKRWINILKLLVSKNKWWSLQEISNEHIGSVRAIQSDLEQMKSFQTENGEPLIHIKPRQGISICNTQTIRVDYYIKEILKDTIEIRLIDGIFSKKTDLSMNGWTRLISVDPHCITRFIKSTRSLHPMKLSYVQIVCSFMGMRRRFVNSLLNFCLKCMEAGFGHSMIFQSKTQLIYYRSYFRCLKSMCQMWR